jgi:hypothetical protein
MMNKDIRRAQLRRHLQSDTRRQIERDLAKLRHRNAAKGFLSGFVLLVMLAFATVSIWLIL